MISDPLSTSGSGSPVSVMPDQTSTTKTASSPSSRKHWRRKPPKRPADPQPEPPTRPTLAPRPYHWAPRKRLSITQLATVRPAARVGAEKVQGFVPGRQARLDVEPMRLLRRAARPIIEAPQASRTFSLPPLTGPGKHPQTVASTPSGAAPAVGDIFLWELTTRQETSAPPPVGSANGPSSLALSPDGKVLAVAATSPARSTCAASNTRVARHG